jgi:hypothetical protein
MVTRTGGLAYPDSQMQQCRDDTLDTTYVWEL